MIAQAAAAMVAETAVADEAIVGTAGIEVIAAVAVEVAGSILAKLLMELGGRKDCFRPRLRDWLQPSGAHKRPRDAPHSMMPCLASALFPTVQKHGRLKDARATQTTNFMNHSGNQPTLAVSDKTHLASFSFKVPRR